MKYDHIYVLRLFEEIGPLSLEVFKDYKALEDCLNNSVYKGWFDEKESALELLENKFSADEDAWGYALIEKVMSGIYPHVSERWLFKFNCANKRYEEIEISGKLKEPRGCWTIR